MPAGKGKSLPHHHQPRLLHPPIHPHHALVHPIWHGGIAGLLQHGYFDWRFNPSKVTIDGKEFKTEMLRYGELIRVVEPQTVLFMDRNQQRKLGWMQCQQIVPNEDIIRKPLKERRVFKAE